MTEFDRIRAEMQDASVLLQEWRVGRKVGRTIYRESEAGDDGVLIGVMDTREQARLAAAAPELYRVLRRVRWQLDAQCRMRCVGCYTEKGNGHRADCDLRAALRKGGVSRDGPPEERRQRGRRPSLAPVRSALRPARPSSGARGHQGDPRG